MRSPESVRAEAAEHFAAMVGMASRYGRDVAEAKADQLNGMRIVDAALALPVGALLPLREHLKGDHGSGAMAEFFRVVPYITGSLRLLDLEFAHEQAGVVPHDILRDVQEGKDASYKGHIICPEVVYVQLRRLALA